MMLLFFFCVLRVEFVFELKRTHKKDFIREISTFKDYIMYGNSNTRCFSRDEYSHIGYLHNVEF